MHKSRLSTFVIDCQADDVDAAALFWGQALGRAVKVPAPDGELYRDLASREAEPQLMVRKVKHESRVHLDIESDDIEAEVKRLELLGATRVEQRKTWWVMRAPTGQLFCVVRPQRGPLGDDANRWP
jgi:hypothetical protein